MKFLLLRLLILAAPILLASGEVSHGSTVPTLRWASTGGGWRAHFACAGFANLFSRLGILPRFGAISTNSGAAWFAAQLFYSREFYDRVADVDGMALYDFVLEWMGAYGDMLSGAIRDTADMNAELEERVCNVTGLGEGRETRVFSDLCHTLVYFGGDWALFVQEMLDQAAKSYGDADFINRSAGRDKEQLNDTDLLIQAALVPNSRVRGQGTGVYLGPKMGTNQTEIYSAVISASYVVDKHGTRYEYGTEGGTRLVAGTSPISSDHSFSDWKGFHLYPGGNGTHLISAENYTDVFNDMSEEFFGGGESSVIQVAAISSAAVGTVSPLAPSTFTQSFSEQRHGIDQNAMFDARLKTFDSTVARLYDQPLLDGFAVCSQWPNPCGTADGLFVDGAFSDNPAFAINVGQFHLAGGDLTETLRVILTNTNFEWGTDFQYTQMLQYFESPINAGVDPGEFNWPLGMWVPYQSPQIFAEFLDADMLDALIEPIPGSNMTTAILSGTTIENNAFDIRAGQRVEVLLINLNEPITTYIATPDQVQLYSEPLANMTKNIAENEELARRIKEFVGPSSDEGSGSEPDMSSTACLFGWSAFSMMCVFLSGFLHGN